MFSGDVKSDTGLKEDAGEYWGISLLSKSALIYASWAFMFFLHLSLSFLIFFILSSILPAWV